MSREGIQSGYLILRHLYGSPELVLPESVVFLRDATGVYIDLAWRDLDALTTPRPGTAEGLLDAFATATSAHADRFEDDPER